MEDKITTIKKEDDNIIIVNVDYNDDIYSKSLQEYCFPEPEDGVGGDKDANS